MTFQSVSYVEYKRRNELRDYKRVFCLCNAIIQKWCNPDFYTKYQ